MKKCLSILLILITIAFAPMTSLAAPKQMPDGGVFDPEYYAANNPDVVAAFGTDESLLYMHYTLAGKNEGRQPYAPGTQVTAAKPTVPTAPATSSSIKTMPDGSKFDPVFYATTYPDVYAAFGNNEALLYRHYLQYGKKEGRQPYAGNTTGNIVVNLRGNSVQQSIQIKGTTTIVTLGGFTPVVNTNPPIYSKPVTAQRPVSNGYIWADFATFNSHAFENGLKDTKIYTTAVVTNIETLVTASDKSIPFQMKSIACILKDADGYQWCVSFVCRGYREQAIKQALLGKPVVLYGRYAGYSDVLLMPGITANIFVTSTGDVYNVDPYY